MDEVTMDEVKSLEEFARGKAAKPCRPCTPCLLAASQPNLWDQVKTARAKAPPTAWDVISQWLKTRGHAVSGDRLRVHAKRHGL